MSTPTSELIYDAIYIPGYRVQIAAALDAGDTAEAGRLLAEAVKHARVAADELDAYRAEEASDASAPRLTVVPVSSISAVHPIFERVLGDFRRSVGSL